jgi:ATP-dependent helicase HepA
MLTHAYSPGQRVMAPAEPQLGLGVVTECVGRRFQVLFAKADVQRTYSTDTTAVHRFRAKVGDTVTTLSGADHVVADVREDEGILAYLTGEGDWIPELQLSLDLKHSDPMSALTLGKPGSPATFTSRTRAYKCRALGRAQEYRGLGSARVELLPHQLYVTERVSQMWRPRVLLADEVGLGKTIEAGLIGVRMGALGRAQSVAVVAPRALVGQWLAEFFRRFARPLTLFDPDLEELPQDLLIPADDLEFLPANFERELLIVDEAHHYYEDQVLKILAERSGAVLFLTATPSLGGQDSLFGLLHQLDPLRYPDPESVQQHGHEWAQVAELARKIEGCSDLSVLIPEIEAAFPADDDLSQLASQNKGDELLQRLVDRHGLGRSLIRNRRARLETLFSGREVLSHEIAAKDESEFLISLLRQLKELGKKVLVMVESTADVSRWAKLLAKRTTLSVARFDETMSLLERDRQAAWFNRTVATPGEEEPASVLLCSELGGEGRNFQVAHHLVLLGLPRHPDKLEQRIGRLDRIGQTERVTVHVPLPTSNLPRRAVFAWLHEGLNAFTRPLTEGQRAYHEFGDRLQELENTDPQDSDFQTWLQSVKEWTAEAQEQAEKAIDPLIDRMSYDKDKAAVLQEKVRQQQAVLSSHLQDDLGELLDSLGIILEPRGDDGLYFVRAGDMMFVEALPGLPPGGALVTFDRTLANRRDDVEFLHFEHRLVQNTLDLILDEGVGKATAARWKGAARTTVCFQFLYVLEAEGPQRLSLGRFLPVHAIILSGDLSGVVEKGNVLPGNGPIDERALERLSADVVETLLARTSDLRPRLKVEAKELLAEETRRMKLKAVESAGLFFEREQARLSHMEESEQFRHLTELALAELAQQKNEVLECLEKAQWRFDAVRMILCQE